MYNYTIEGSDSVSGLSNGYEFGDYRFRDVKIKMYMLIFGIRCSAGNPLWVSPENLPPPAMSHGEPAAIGNDDL